MPWASSAGVITATADAGISITAAASVAGGVRFTATNSYAQGDPVTITGTTDYNGNWIVSAVTGTTFDVVDQIKIDRTALAFTSSQTGTVARGVTTAGLNGVTGVTRSGTAGRYVYTMSAVRIVNQTFWLHDPDVAEIQFLDDCAFPMIDNQADMQIGRRRVVGGKVLYSNGTALVCTKTPTAVPQTQTSGLLCSTTGAPRFYWYGGEIRSTCSVGIGGFINSSSSLTRLNGDCNLEAWSFVNLNGTLANGSYFGAQFRPGDMTAGRNCRVTGGQLDSATDANSAAPIVLFSSTFNLFSCTFKKGRFQQFASPTQDLEASDLVFANNAGSYDVALNLFAPAQDYVLAVRNADIGSGQLARLVMVSSNVRGILEVRQTINLTVRDSSGNLVSDGRSYALVSPSTAITPFNRGDLNYTAAREYTVAPTAGVGSFVALMGVGWAPGSGTTPTLSYWDETKNGSDTLHIDHSYYGYQLFRDTVTARGNGGTAVTPRLLPDTSITQSNRATVQAYTTIETLDKLYDRAKDWRCTAGNLTYPSRTTLLISGSGDALDLGNRNLVIDATAGSAFAVNTGTNTITIKASTLSAGSKFKRFTTAGTVTFSNGAAAGNDLIYTASGTTSAVLTITGAVSGSRYRVQRTDNGVLIGEGTSSGGPDYVRYSHTGSDIAGTLRVRKGSAAPKYLPFETAVTLTASGASVSVAQVADTIA